MEKKIKGKKIEKNQLCVTLGLSKLSSRRSKEDCWVFAIYSIVFYASHVPTTPAVFEASPEAHFAVQQGGVAPHGLERRGVFQ
jgi:hypothetical protein